MTQNKSRISFVAVSENEIIAFDKIVSISRHEENERCIQIIAEAGGDFLTWFPDEEYSKDIMKAVRKQGRLINATASPLKLEQI